MRIIWLSLVLACLCTLSPCLNAAEYQPTAQEWTELIRMAEEVGRKLTDQMRKIERSIEEREKNPQDLAHVTAAGAPEFPRPSVDMLKAQYKTVWERNEDLATYLAEMKALKEGERTREQYLKYLRPVKQATYQYQLDSMSLFWGVAVTKNNSIAGLEAELKAIRAAQPERIAPAPLPKDLQLSWAAFPRLDGSTTAQPLSTLIACRLLGLGAEWHMREIRDARNGEGTHERILIPACGEAPMLVRPNATEAAGFPGLRLNMVHSGTGTAYRHLIAGAADLIIVARAPSPDELALATEKQVEFELRPIGYDAFIFLLHHNNPVDSLTVKQIRDIYTDNILNWHEVGGKTQRIIAFQRERNSGSQETMESLVMPGLEMAPPLEPIIGYGMGGPYNRLHGQENGIGYTFYYYHTVQSPETPTLLVRSERKQNLKVCAVNGILPSADTIRNRSYPYVTEVFAVVRKGTPAANNAVRLRDWLLTAEGQAVVRESGYVPLPE